MTDSDTSARQDVVTNAKTDADGGAYQADFSTLYHALATCMIELDDTGHVADITGSAAAAGLATCDVGSVFADYIHPRDLPIWRTIVLRLLDAHSVGPVALRLSHSGGDFEIIDVTAMRQFRQGIMRVQIAVNPFLGRVLPMQAGRPQDAGAADRLGPADFSLLAKQMTDMAGGDLQTPEQMLDALHRLLEKSASGKKEDGSTELTHFLASLHTLLGHSASECRSSRVLAERRAASSTRSQAGDAADKQARRRARVDPARPMSLSDAIKETLATGGKSASTVERDHDLVSDAEAARAVLYALQNSGNTNEQVRSMNQLTEKLDVNVEKTKEQIRSFKKIVLQEQFDIFLQPIVSLADQQIHHFEGLVRFENTIYKGSPFEFITFAEKMGVIHEFDMAMTMKMVSVIKRLRRIGYELKGAVNLSGHSVQSPAFLRQFFKLLEDCGDVRQNLSFELTESSRIKDLEATNSTLNRIRQFGHKVALDDFGAGASGLQYLRKLKVDAVKIDGAYVRQAVSDAQDRKFLASIVDLCASRDIDIVGECVETEEDAKLLGDMGVGYGQGWFFSKPMPIDDALKLLPS